MAPRCRANPIGAIASPSVLQGFGEHLLDRVLFYVLQGVVVGMDRARDVVERHAPSEHLLRPGELERTEVNRERLLRHLHVNVLEQVRVERLYRIDGSVGDEPAAERTQAEEQNDRGRQALHVGGIRPAE